MKKILQQPFFIKLFHWEYWPFNVVYTPIYLYWFILFLRTRSFFFFNAANPTITNGGFLLESKKAIYDLLPSALYPATLFFNNEISAAQVEKKILEANLQFPLLGKPDIGMRGFRVKKLESWEAVFEYVKESKVNFLIQEFITYENEIGIFYYRYPNKINGEITGIVGKEFLSLTGDGLSTMEELLQKDQRCILQLITLRATYGADLQRVLAKEENYLLVPYGNHSRGAKFLDLSKLIEPELTTTIDTLCKQIPGFYFGRMDIKYQSWEELIKGKQFSIIELNGAGSEPTHIYDPKHSVFYAWKEIIRHLHILVKVSSLNHQLKQIPYMDFQKGVKMLKENAKYLKKISNQQTLKTGLSVTK